MLPVITGTHLIHVSSIPKTLSDPARWNMRSPVCPVDLHNYARTVWPTAIKFGAVTLVGIGMFLGGPHVPPPNGRNSSASQFSRFPVFMLTPFEVAVAVWCSSNALVLINAVALHRAWLVLGWVTAFG